MKMKTLDVFFVTASLMLGFHSLSEERQKVSVVQGSIGVRSIGEARLDTVVLPSLSAQATEGSAGSCPCQDARQKSRLGFGAGAVMLDELPKGASALAVLKMTEAASPDSADNAGYKTFWAMQHFKSHTRLIGGNALIGFRGVLDKPRNKLIFTATAAKVEMK